VVKLEASKAKFAKRVIEIFEYFDGGYGPSTVMDIARQYGRPQSSTSDLLSSLVEIGLLYKDPITRDFKPTPRLATLGLASQPDILRDGRLFNYMDQLARTTRKTVALFGVVGTHVQIFRLLPSLRRAVLGVETGCSELLTSSTAGQLLLSTVDPAQIRGRLWRLNAEADASEKFELVEMLERIGRFRLEGHATGSAGFITGELMSAVLLPRVEREPALALGILYPEQSVRDADAFAATLKHGINQLFSPEAQNNSKVATPFVRAV
jgi:DNA-binding IclR family transcriptional regulator